MSQLFSIQDDKIVINKLDLTSLEGNVTHTGSLVLNGTETINGDVTVTGDVTVQRKLIVDVIQANQIINNNLTNNGAAGSTKFLASTEAELNGQGIAWGTLNIETQLAYRTGGRLWTNMNFDLAPGNTYQINNLDILTFNTLGSSVVKSSLRQLAPLNNLTVVGDTNLGDVLVVASDTSRVGINTENPNATFSVVSDNVEVILGSFNGAAAIGSFTNNDLVIVSDNIPRITVRAGETHIGAKNQTATNLYVHGTVYANEVITNTKTTSNLEFNNIDTGLVWTDSRSNKQLLMTSSALWSTEDINLSGEKSYKINDHLVLSETTLGSGITSSNLSVLGTLDNLTVSGSSNLATVTAQSIHTTELTVNAINLSSINSDSLSVNVNNTTALEINNNAISIGNVQTSARPVKVFGNLSINVNTPDPTLALQVAGNIGFAGRKFITADASPANGSFNKGDTCWNTEPTIGGYMGWVCIVAGTPGQWSPFGLIN
jgi:cytoskeletal protein CcmA (bactofilin family)